jgi:hypothetical protein
LPGEFDRDQRWQSFHPSGRRLLGLHRLRSYYLGADIGGNGSLLYVKDTGTTLEWVIKKADGKMQSIIVQKEKSNDY